MALTFFVRFLILLLALPTCAYGAIHRPNRPSHQIAYFYNKSEELVTKQQNQTQAEDSVYRSFFGQPDHQISMIYQDQWAQHERNLPFRSSSWRGEFLSNSVTSGTVLYDWQVREQFARQVLRMKVDHGVREYLKTFRGSAVVSKAQNTLEKLQNVAVPIGDSTEQSRTQVRLGYDVFSDSSKLEMVGGTVDVGLYKSALLSNPGSLENTVMTMSSDLGAQVGRASVSVPLSAENIQTTLSKQISPSVSTTLSSTQPLNGKQDSFYQWNVAFSF